MKNLAPGNEGRRFTVIAFFLIFAISFAIYYLTNEGAPTAYNNFVRLADAFLHGRLYLLKDIKWIELAAYKGKYYIIPPPMPAILILPFVAIFGLSFNQTLASIVLGSVNVSLAFLTARSLTKSLSIQFWTTLMFGFGTIHWWVATAGGVWTFSQVTAVTFLFLAIYFTLSNSHPFIPSVFLGAAYWSRLQCILSFPFFLIYYSNEWISQYLITSIIHRIKIKPVFYLLLGVTIFVSLNLLYNYLRFDTIADVSYYLMQNVLNEPWYSKGYFDISYIPRHLKVLFWGFPKIISGPPYVEPSWNGMAIWITTPAFAYAFLAGIRNRLAIGCWISIALIALVDFMHGTWGVAQFGYRYAVDFYPFLFLLTVQGMGADIKWHQKLLITIGILVNLWGVLWIYKFGWVTV
jgi:hypothetical protein